MTSLGWEGCTARQYGLLKSHGLTRILETLHPQSHRTWHLTRFPNLPGNSHGCDDTFVDGEISLDVSGFYVPVLRPAVQRLSTSHLIPTTNPVWLGWKWQTGSRSHTQGVSRPSGDPNPCLPDRSLTLSPPDHNGSGNQTLFHTHICFPCSKNCNSLTWKTTDVAIF